jgi:LETM1 and EF-hand domain-containing protein 1
VSALAILIPQQRGYATEQSTSNSSQSYPPPGFNAEQAKKPIPQEQAQSSQKVAKPETFEPVTKDVKPASSKTAVESQKTEEKEAKKLTMGQKVKKELQHYWDGTKLLATEVKISTRLAVKMAAGYELSRREHRQVGQNSDRRDRDHLTNFGFQCNSFNVPPRTWVGWFLSLFSLSFPSPNSCSPSP